jgi:hypothetical protein
VTIVGAGVIAPGELRRLISEEFDRLLQAVGRDPKLLSDEQIVRMREQARQVVIKRPRADDRTLVGSSSDDGAVRAVQASDALAAELRPVRDEFASPDADISERSAIAHLKATAVLAASQRPATYENYVAALEAVADDAGRRDISDDIVAEHCEAAAALSDLAEHNLRTRGVFKPDPHYEEQFIAEISAVSAEHNLPYYDERP